MTPRFFRERLGGVTHRCIEKTKHGVYYSLCGVEIWSDTVRELKTPPLLGRCVTCRQIERRGVR